MAEIVDIFSKSHVDTATGMPSPDEVLLNAMGNLGTVVLMGWDKDDNFFTGSSTSDGPGVLWLMELAKKRLMYD